MFDRSGSMAKGTSARAEAAAGLESDGLEMKPLYRQVRETLIRRMVDGVWAQGEPLPSEMQLAAELGVSQGTVRKALDEMAAENLVTRRQGRGTFVTRHDEDRIMFQFFRLVTDAGEKKFPASRVLSVTKARANAAECEALALPRGARVLRVRRVRVIDGHPVIVEGMTLPEALFPGLGEVPALPNNLYGLYATRYGVKVARAQEKLKAVAVSGADAQMLGVAPGTPALRIDRLAYSLEQVPVEWRVSLCLTEHMHYLSDVM